jgi:multidrug efflux pump subunit AcrB
VSLTRKLVDNRHAVWAIALAAAIFGALAYTSLPMQLFPDTSPPLVNVITAYPGASAEYVADELSQPLEEEIVSVEGVVSVSSSAQDNMAMTTVEFQYDRDADLAAVDVQNAISRIRGELPDGIREPQVSTFSTGDRPISRGPKTGADLRGGLSGRLAVYRPRHGAGLGILD